eukprot:m.336910 g.336910  ORF g.336910 m.336910 type:complete len:233 (+) comp17994_c0_seq1:109-807(+)
MATPKSVWFDSSVSDDSKKHWASIFPKCKTINDAYKASYCFAANTKGEKIIRIFQSKSYKDEKIAVFNSEAIFALLQKGAKQPVVDLQVGLVKFILTPDTAPSLEMGKPKPKKDLKLQEVEEEEEEKEKKIQEIEEKKEEEVKDNKKKRTRKDSDSKKEKEIKKPAISISESGQEEDATESSESEDPDPTYRPRNVNEIRHALEQKKSLNKAIVFDFKKHPEVFRFEKNAVK